MHWTREELISLRTRAEIASENVESEGWKRAWLDFAQACDYLDAMMARCDTPVDGGKIWTPET